MGDPGEDVVFLVLGEVGGLRVHVDVELAVLDVGGLDVLGGCRIVCGDILALQITVDDRRIGARGRGSEAGVRQVVVSVSGDVDGQTVLGRGGLHRMSGGDVRLGSLRGVADGDRVGLLPRLDRGARTRGRVPVRVLTGGDVEVDPVLRHGAPPRLVLVGLRSLWVAACGVGLHAEEVGSELESFVGDVDRSLLDLNDVTVDRIELVPLAQVVHVRAVAGVGAGDGALAVLDLELRIGDRPVGHAAVVGEAPRTFPLDRGIVAVGIDCAGAVGDLDVVAGVVVLSLGVGLVVDQSAVAGLAPVVEVRQLAAGLLDRGVADGEVLVVIDLVHAACIVRSPDACHARVSGITGDEEVAPTEVGTAGGFVVDRPAEHCVVDGLVDCAECRGRHAHRQQTGGCRNSGPSRQRRCEAPCSGSTRARTPVRHRFSSVFACYTAMSACAQASEPILDSSSAEVVDLLNSK